MKRVERIATAVAVAASIAVAPAALAVKGKAAPNQPGKFKEWKGEIDQLEIVKVFRLADYDAIAVWGFATDDTPLPEKNDNTYEPVKKILTNIEGAVAAGIADELDRKPIEVEASDRQGPGVLVVTGVVEEMDPGSQAARYWGGFGAGAARTRLRIEVKDGESGEVLLRITQERRSGVGTYGGGYEELLNRNLAAIGADVAFVLGAF